jgi:flagellin FlaB
MEEKKMKRMNDSGFTGLEAAIVLIAFVVVAAVFSYVILGAGFFTTQKAQETIYKGVEQSTSNLQLVGNVYGMENTTKTLGITDIQFTLTLAPGAPSMDLSKMTVVYSSGTTAPQIITADPSVGVIKPGEQSNLKIIVPDGIQKSTRFTIELRPSSGASLSITRTTPAAIEGTNILY